MFSNLHPVEHYLKEIKVTPKRWQDSKPYVPPTSLPFIHDTENKSRSPSPFGRKTSQINNPPCLCSTDASKKKQILHREITYYFGRDKKFPNHDIPKDHRKEKHTHGKTWDCNDVAIRQLYQYSRYTPRQRTLMKDAILQRSRTYA